MNNNIDDTQKEICLNRGSKFCAKRLIGEKAICENQVCYTGTRERKTQEALPAIPKIKIGKHEICPADLYKRILNKIPKAQYARIIENIEKDLNQEEVS